MEKTLQIGPETRVQTSGQGVFSELGEQSVLMHLRDGIYYALNEVGTSIWKHIQEPMTFAQLVDRLMDEYEVERAVCEEDTRAMLLQLYAKDLVTLDAE